MKTDPKPIVPSKRRNGAAATAVQTQLEMPTPGDGREPTAEGLYWVRRPEFPLPFIALVEGKLPFLRVTLMCPREPDAPRFRPTTAEIEALQWLGEIKEPAEARS
jgi:hypothetical protein